MRTNVFKIDSNGLDDIFPGKNTPFIIAGPCSAESEQQVMDTAVQLSKIPEVSVFRAGVWKPRTRPNGFEGVGVKGLQWLKNIKRETGLLTATEVANSYHISEALKYGIDVLWIGARTSVNPFAVQEIASALRGVDIPVLIKNPLNPDINSWIGALERISQVGIKKLGAIHRGFSMIEKTSFRNPPKWEIPIELKRHMPDLPIICDPSHIAGNRTGIAELSQNALDLAMQGLMIECHTDPDSALSDPQQQIKPSALKRLLNQLVIRKPEGNGLNENGILEMLRQEIDTVDKSLIEILLRRIEIANQIGHYKKNHDMTILQVNRWQQLLEDRLHQAKELGLSESLVKEIFQILHNRSIEIQSDLLNKKV